MNALNKKLDQFKRCADEAPQGMYADARALNDVIGEACDGLMRELRALGLKADNCDLIHHVEATIYDYVKQSNPENSMFAVAEGFGAAMDGPAASRVWEQSQRDRDFLRATGALA